MNTTKKGGRIMRTIRFGGGRLTNIDAFLYRRDSKENAGQLRDRTHEKEIENLQTRNLGNINVRCLSH